MGRLKTMSNEILPSILRQFQYYKVLGDRTFDQLTTDELFWSPDPDANSIAVIVKHLWGNMRSRWTDFLVSDGEKPWRERESEFDHDITEKEVMIQRWNEGWDCLFRALQDLEENDLDKVVFIRNQGHTVLEAIFRQLAHYAYHVGQIVYIGRSLKGATWKSLSIPRGGSASYNNEKFSSGQHRAHYTDDLIKDAGADGPTA